MMLNIPAEETQESELNTKVSPQTAKHAAEITAHLINTGASNTDVILEDGNALLNALPETSLAYVPKTTTIPKKIHQTRKETTENNPTANETKTAPIPRLFSKTDKVLVSVQKLATPKAIPAFKKWITALKKEEGIPPHWPEAIDNYLPKEVTRLFSVFSTYVLEP